MGFAVHVHNVAAPMRAQSVVVASSYTGFFAAAWWFFRSSREPLKKNQAAAKKNLSNCATRQSERPKVHPKCKSHPIPSTIFSRILFDFCSILNDIAVQNLKTAAMTMGTPTPLVSLTCVDSAEVVME